MKHYTIQLGNGGCATFSCTCCKYHVSTKDFDRTNGNLRTQAAAAMTLHYDFAHKSNPPIWQALTNLEPNGHGTSVSTTTLTVRHHRLLLPLCRSGIGKHGDVSSASLRIKSYLNRCPDGRPVSTIQKPR
jgi:hypothetical protein